MTRFFQVGATDFREVFEAARDTSPLIREYTSEWTDAPGAFYLSGDATAGFVVRPDGELCLVFSLRKGQGSDLMAAAKAQGAVHGDCYDGYLVTFYARHGFREVRREPNWTPGGPDVVYFRLGV